METTKLPPIDLIHPYFTSPYQQENAADLLREAHAKSNGDCMSDHEEETEQSEKKYWKIKLAIKGGEEKVYFLHQEMLKIHSELFGDLIRNSFDFSDVMEQSTSIELLIRQELTVFEKVIIPCLYGYRFATVNRGSDLAIAFNFFDYLQMDAWKQVVKKEMDDLYSFKSFKLKAECLDQHTDYFLKIFFSNHPTFVIDSYYVNYHYERFVIGINRFLMEKHRKRCLSLFLGFDISTFITLFSNEKIGIYSEHQMYKAISWFIESHSELNQQERDSLWNLLRVCNLTDAEFKEVIQSELISSSLKNQMEMNRINGYSEHAPRQYMQSIVYCGSSSGNLDIWDLYTEGCNQTVHVHSSFIHDVKTFEREGTNFIFTCGEDGCVTMCKCTIDHKNLQHISSIKLQDTPILTMDLNENFLVVNSSLGQIHILDISPKSLTDPTPVFKTIEYDIKKCDTTGVRCICIYGDYLFTGFSNGAIYTWHAGNLSNEWSFSKVHNESVMYMKVVNIGTRDYLLSASCDRSVILWSINENAILTFVKRIEGMSGYVYAFDVMQFSPDLTMNYVVTGSTDRQVIISQLDGTQLKSFKGHTNFIYEVIVNNLSIISFGDDFSIRVWNSESGECDQSIHVPSSMRCAALPSSSNSTPTTPHTTCPIQ